jgi:steroid delta-isomerase-like uncharacterized protein
MTNPNVAIARRFFEEAWNQRRIETVDELITPVSACESESGILRGPEEFKTKVYQPLIAAFPDLRITIEGTVAEGDQVVVRWTAAGTHTGDGLGLPATGRSIAIRGMTWIRFEAGKMIEGVDSWNQREMIESLK